MNKENKKVISIRLIYIIPIIAMIITIVLCVTKKYSIKTEQIAKNSEQEEINVASINREEKIETTSRSGEITRNNDELQNENLQAENNEEPKEEVVVEEQKAENTNEEQEENKYISIKDVKISKDMDYVTHNLVKNPMLIAIFVLGIVVASYFVSVIGYSRKK